MRRLTLNQKQRQIAAREARTAVRVLEKEEIVTVHLDESSELSRQKRIERFAVGGALVFVCMMIGFVSFTDSNPVTYTVEQIRRLGSGSSYRAGNRYQKDPCVGLTRDQEHACREKAYQTESSWQGIVRNEGGKSSAFVLHSRKKGSD